MKTSMSKCSFGQGSKKMLTIMAGLALLFTAYHASAQKRWSLEVRSGADFPTRRLGGVELQTGIGFEGTVAYRFMPHLSAYAGWGWNQFSPKQSSAEAGAHFEETGYTFGLQFTHPILHSRVSCLAGAGGIYNHIETENSHGDIVDNSGHGLGWQADAGLVFPFGDWKIIPGIRYRSLSRDINPAGNGSKIAADLNYISAGIGVSWSF